MVKKPLIASPHLRRCRATGCQKAAIVLERLMWWWREGTPIFYGEEWRAKPRDQLMAECGLSLRQIERSLTLMKRKQLIETSRHRFGKNQDTVMHYRLLPRALALFSGVEFVDETAPSASAAGAPCP